MNGTFTCADGQRLAKIVKDLYVCDGVIKADFGDCGCFVGYPVDDYTLVDATGASLSFFVSIDTP